MLIGVAGITFFTLLITLVQTGEQLIIVRLLTGLAGGFAVFAPFPIAAELMPARHRRTFAAVYEMALACSFAVLPVRRLSARRQSERLPADGAARRARLLRHAGADLFPDPGKPALVFAQRPRRGGGRHRQPDYPAGRQPGAAADGCRARRQYADGARGAAALSGVVPSRPTALDGNRDLQLRLLRHCVFSDLGAAAEGSGRSGRRRHLELWRDLAGIRREHTGKGLHRLPDGDHRATLDDLLCPRRLAARPFPDDDGAPSRTLRDGDDGHRRADDRLHRAVDRDRLSDLPLRAVPDGAARARTCLWRVDRADLFRGAGALPDGTVHRLRRRYSSARYWWS